MNVLSILSLFVLLLLYNSHNQNNLVMAINGHICGTMLGRPLINLQALTIKDDTQKLLVIINNWTVTVPLDDVDILNGALLLTSKSNEQLGKWNSIEWLSSTVLAAVTTEATEDTTATKPENQNSGELQALNLIGSGFLGVQFKSPDQTHHPHKLINLADGKEVMANVRGAAVDQLKGKYAIISDGRGMSYVLRANEFDDPSKVTWVPSLSINDYSALPPPVGLEKPAVPSYYAALSENSQVIQISLKPFADTSEKLSELPKVEELGTVFGFILRGFLHLAIGARQTVFIIKDPSTLSVQLGVDKNSSLVSLNLSASVPFSSYFNCTDYDGPPINDDGTERELEDSFTIFTRLGVAGMLLLLVILLTLVIVITRCSRKSSSVPGKHKSVDKKEVLKKGANNVNKGKKAAKGKKVRKTSTSDTSTSTSVSTSKTKSYSKPPRTSGKGKESSWKWS